ncbi:MAG: hypothetical protein FJX72_22310 [Armatimonadetes bacterium]|nr:hypothetical protein [Armatimonadota bacterium]
MPIRQPRTNQWPRGFHMWVYEAEEGRLVVVEETGDRRYDLSDELFLHTIERTVFLGIEIVNPNWPVWDAGSLDWIENRILWDLDFDGNVGTVARHTPDRAGHPCTEEFIWKVEVTG